jgi:hypothetical protein
LCAAAVRVGKSFTNLTCAIKYALSNANAKILFVLPSADQRSLVWEDFLTFYKSAPFISKIDNTKYNVHLGKNCIIKFRLGSMPHAKSLKGNKFDFLIVDEASLMQQIVWEEYLSFTLATTPLDKLKVIFSTTPRGNDYIYALYQKGLDPEFPSYASVHAPTLSNPLVTPEYIETLRKSLSPNIFKQECYAEFIANSGGLFENITDAVNKKQFKYDPSQRYFAAIDPGVINDFTVLTIIDSFGNIVDFLRTNQKEMQTIAKDLVNKLNQWGKPKCYIETNMYQGMLEMIKDLGYRDIFPFMTTSKSKSEIVEDTMVAFQEFLVGLPDDEYFVSEFFSFSYEYNPKTRNISYAATKGSHDDCVMSYCIARKCMKDFKHKTLKYAFT